MYDGEVMLLFIGSTRGFYLEMPRCKYQSRSYALAYVMVIEELNPHSNDRDT